MREMLSTTALIMGRGRMRTAPWSRTDGSQAQAHGPCVGHVSPEAASGGPIGLVEDGDIIEIDIPGRSLHIRGDKKRNLTEGGNAFVQSESPGNLPWPSMRRW